MVNEDSTKDKEADLPLIPKKILVVVPDPDTKKEICNSLTSIGYKVDSVKNAEEGLAFLSEIVPDLIISDIDMPGLTGIEFCIKVRQNIQTAAVPLILIADFKKGSNRFGSLKLGADDYISKPLDPTELILKIEDKLERFSSLRKLINLDAFTSLYNRDFFDRSLKEIFKISSRYRHKFSLVIFDIDYFKTFNDTYGHQIGDNALKEVAKMIKKGLREVDTVARYGGDEFVAIMPETSKKNATIAIERIKKELEQKPFQFEGVPSSLHITISAGLATYPEDAQTDYELINKADLALYADKKKR
jgi:diguanylate cyclase (GGDEF)-like protein